MEEKDDEVMEETNEETNEEREEETKDEIRDEVYVNDDEVEMLRSIEKKFGVLEEKIDNMISMFVDSGAIIQDGADISEQERESYEDDFINIDEMDLSL